MRTVCHGCGEPFDPDDQYDDPHDLDGLDYHPWCCPAPDCVQFRLWLAETDALSRTRGGGQSTILAVDPSEAHSGGTCQ